MTTRDQLADAYRACRRSIGTDGAKAIVEKFGGDGIDDVPQSKWPQLLAALKAKTERDDDDWMESGVRPKSMAELDVAGVWARFNGDWKQRRGGA